MATQGISSSLELRVQFCLLVCCTYPSSSTVNKEKNLIDQRASLLEDTRETQQIPKEDALCCSNNNNNNNNNNRTERCNSRFFTISSLRREPSPTRTLKWPGCGRVQITCNTSSAYHVQNVIRVTWYEGTAQLLSLTELKSHLFQHYFIDWTINRWKRGGNRSTLRKSLATSFSCCCWLVA